MKMNCYRLSSNLFNVCLSQCKPNLTCSNHIQQHGLKLKTIKFCSGSSILNHENQDTPKKPKVQELLENASPLKRSLKDTTWATSPYPEGTVFQSEKPEKFSLKPTIDPALTTIITFPGQGSQFVGMGANLLKYKAVHDLFASASEILGYNLLKICLEGPAIKLNKTEYCQPAVLVCSIAALESLKEKNPEVINNCYAACGFSVGEIAALVFAGSLNFEKAVSLVKIRAEAMALCAKQAPGGMVTVLYGADSTLSDALKDAKEHCKSKGIEDPECSIANYLFPSCKVIAGHNEALDYLAQNADKYKLRRLSRLPVSGAFHTKLMKPASEAFRRCLEKANVDDPIISVHSNVDGLPYTSAFNVIKKLPKQIYSPVKWEQTLHHVYARSDGVNFPATYECGPGKSLNVILRKVNAKASQHSFNIGV